MLTLENLTILSLTRHWVRIDADWYREAWIRDAAGCVRFVAILDDLLT
jgi:hypothetical protein